MTTLIGVGLLLLLEGCLAQSIYENSIEDRSCCYGRTTFSHGEVVQTLPQYCLSLECYNGYIRPRDHGEPGSKTCCYFDGAMYAEGEQLTSHCVTLTCRRGQWVHNNQIEECCKTCDVYNDPHLTTFDGYNYDWHGLCNYTITQLGNSYYPEFGVFSDFVPCFNGIPGTSCLHKSTFKNDKSTLIHLTHSSNSLATLEINSMDGSSTFIVPSSGIHHVTSISGTHSVLAWREGDCVFLAGSSRILVRHCSNHLKVWAYPTHTNKLQGLCGHFNFYQKDDMTNRDGTVHALNPWPMTFPDSWKTNEQLDRSCMTPCTSCPENTSNPCKATPRELERFQSRCAKELNFIIGRDQDLVKYVASCGWDLCMATQGHVSAAEQQHWIEEVKEIVRDAKIVLAMTEGVWQPGTPPPAGECFPGSRWSEDCNWCTCRSDGTADCFRDICPSDYEHQVGTNACEEHSWWQINGCIWCQCVRGGHICDYKNCIPTTTTTTTTTPTLPTEEVCLYSQDHGYCPYFINPVDRYYYSFMHGRCMQFKYSGCGGNANNFKTFLECQATCGHLTPLTTTTTTTTTTTPFIRPFHCYMQPERGPCEALLQHYFYNSTTELCETFTYGGCGGNNNNYLLRSQCEEECGATTTASSSIPTPPSPPATTTSSHPDYCTLLPSPGNCYDHITRYYYNPQSNTCKTFTYSGCGGNQNNYPTAEWCMAECSTQPGSITMPAMTTTTTSTASSVPVGDRCNQPPDVGRCFEQQWFYYYNHTERICKPFIYGGCDGNDNRFSTKEECEATCAVQPPSTTLAPATTTTTTLPPTPFDCFLPLQLGNCRESHMRYYFDYKMGDCVKFIYTGCDGNNNNFLSYESCRERCRF